MYIERRVLFAVVLGTAGALVAQEPPGRQGEPGKQPPPAAAPTSLGTTGLEMVLPPGMKVADGTPLGLVFQATADEVDGFRDNINLTVGPTSTPQVPDAMIKAELTGQLAKVLTEYAFVADGRLDWAGTSVYWLSGTFRQGEVKVRNLQVLIPGTPCHWLTLTARITSFGERETQLRKALASLRRVGDSEPETAVTVRMQGKRLCVDERGFSIEPPAGWKPADASRAAGAFLLAAGPAIAGFAPNLNVRTQAGAEALDPAAVRKEVQPALAKTFDKFQLAECASRTVGGRKAVRLRASYVQGELPLTVVQYLVPAQPRSFAITYTVPTSEAAKLLAALDASAATIEVVAQEKAEKREPEKKR
jgi:hypothetical protein